MKKVLVLLSIAIVLGLVVGCPQPNDSGTGGGEKVYVQPADEITTKLGDHNFTLKGIQGGKYQYQGTLGGNEDLKEEKKVESFYLAETEVTQGQWKAVMGEWPGTAPNSSNGDGNDYPVYYISWYDAIAFCNKLSFMEGLTPVYSVKVSGVEVDWENITGVLTPDGDDTDWNAVSVKSDATGYRLPIEVEWEYAAGGGKDDRTIYAAPITSDAKTDGVDDITGERLSDYAWYISNNSPSGSKIVGTAGSEKKDEAKSGKANALGLYDMSGNVYEWCYDKLSPTSSNRVCRGGEWHSSVPGCLVATRYSGGSSGRSYNSGFRVARSVSP